MANRQAVTQIGTNFAPLTVRKIGIADLTDSLRKGLADFWAMPTHLMIAVAIYPVIGIIMGRMAAGADLLPLIFPLIMGFALVGPVAATGLYALSRRRERGLDMSWGHAFGVLRSPASSSILTLGTLLLLVFFFWILAAQAIYNWSFAYATVPTSVTAFVDQILTTRAGWTLLVIGNGVGFLFALLVLTISVVSFPLMIDRHVTAATAMATSVSVMMANPVTMLVWGIIIAGSLIIGSVPLLLGLMIVVPVLGHATWHLYRKTVV